MKELISGINPVVLICGIIAFCCIVCGACGRAIVLYVDILNWIQGRRYKKNLVEFDRIDNVFIENVKRDDEGEKDE